MFYINQRNQSSIPDNIQSIFTNYCFIINMIRKELNYIHYLFIKMKGESSTNVDQVSKYVSEEKII